MFLIKSSFMQILLFVSCTVLAHCALEPAMATDHYPDSLETAKSGDDTNTITMQKRPSFFVGSRYGRSDGGVGAASSMFASTKTRRLNVVPRNDRFFLGSRYGKRTSEYMQPVYEQEPTADVASAPTLTNGVDASTTNANSKSNSGFMMSCIYTGVKNLYRCNNIDEINNIISQLTTGQSDDDRK